MFGKKIMQFTIYSKPNCTYCEQAKSLLKSKDIPYQEIILDVGQVKDPSKTYASVKTLKDRVPTAQTVPQIFKNEDYVGGFDALKKILA